MNKGIVLALSVFALAACGGGSKGDGGLGTPTKESPKEVNKEVNKEPDSKTPDNKTPDNKTPDNKTPDNKTPGNTDPEPTPVSGSAPSLVGLWSHAYVSNDCYEAFNFSANGAFDYESMDERITGTYSTSAGSNGRSLLKLNIQTDNGLSDCDGFSEDDSGGSVQFYYEIANNELNLYENATDTELYDLYFGQ